MIDKSLLLKHLLNEQQKIQSCTFSKPSSFTEITFPIDKDEQRDQKDQYSHMVYCVYIYLEKV